MPTAEVAKCDERRQKAFVCTARWWMATLSAPTCSGVSYITTGSAMFYSARAKNRVLPPPEIPAVGASRGTAPSASPAMLGSFHTERSH